MKRHAFVGLAVAATAVVAFPLGLIAAPPKTTNVVTPMTQDLDANGHSITNAFNLGVTNELHANQAFIPGNVNTPWLDLNIGAGFTSFVTVSAGDESPVGRGTPGLYLQRTQDNSAIAVWAKTGPAGTDWTCLAGCSP